MSTITYDDFARVDVRVPLAAPDRSDDGTLQPQLVGG